MNVHLSFRAYIPSCDVQWSLYFDITPGKKMCYDDNYKAAVLKKGFDDNKITWHVGPNQGVFMNYKIEGYCTRNLPL